MARLIVVGVATTLGVMAIDAAVVPRAANLFSFDATWKPQLPVGGHTYSGKYTSSRLRRVQGS